MVVRDPEERKESNLSDSKQRPKRGLKVIVEKSEKQGMRRLVILKSVYFHCIVCEVASSKRGERNRKR